MVTRRNQRVKLDREEVEDDERAITLLSSSDDEEANEDLTLKIVEKALRRRSVKVGSSPLIVAEDEDNEVSDGSTVAVPSSPEDKERKKKRSKSKVKRHEAQELTVISSSGEDEKTEVIKAEELVDSVDTDTVKIADNDVLRKLLRGPRYFDPPSSNWGACYNCGEEGHAAVNCTVPRRKKPCFVCGSLEHNVKQCTKSRDCYICKKGGHNAKKCPEKQKLGLQASKVCLKCGQSGHDMFSCKIDYSPTDLKEIQCYICGLVGHLCCVDSVDTPSKVSCYRCGRMGHTGMSCSRTSAENHGEDTPSTCYRCGEEGHFAKECKGEGTPSSCFRCGGEGHFARECKSSATEEAAPSSCYKCGGGGHFARECRSTAKVSLHQDEPASGSCYKCGGGGHFARECKSTAKVSLYQDEPASGSCYKCGGEGHFARECKSSSQARKRNRYDDEDYMGAKSAPNNLQKSRKRKKDKDKGMTTPQKSKHRGGWIAEDPEEDSFRKSYKNQRSPATPSYSSHRVSNGASHRQTYASPYGGGQRSPRAQTYNHQQYEYGADQGHRSRASSKRSQYGASSSQGSANASESRYSASRFGNSRSDYSSRDYGW